MLTKIEMNVAEKKLNPYELALKELKADLQQAINERIQDFELSYDGMKPSWILDKAKWVAERMKVERFYNREFEEMERNNPGLKVSRYLVGRRYMSEECAFTARKRKDAEGNYHIYCHIDFAVLERNAKKAMKDAEECYVEKLKREKVRRHEDAAAD